MTTDAIGNTAAPPVAVTAASAAERLSMRVVQLGAIAVVLVVSTHKVFELDRFLVPKELALHATAFFAGLLALGAIRRIVMARIDRLLVWYLGLSVLSAIFATNRWLGLRGLAVSASAVLLFWIARALRESGLAMKVLNGIALAIVIAAATSLLQAYGVYTDLFSMNRAPGGTLGNRNFVAHAAAFGLPVLLFTAFRATRARSFAMRAAGIAIVSAALVLSRSRAAWLASAAMLLVFFLALVISGPLRRDGRTSGRFVIGVVAAGAGVAAALVIPNELHWRSENPYLESVRGVTSYDEGSGRGRLIQYGRSLEMALRHPLLGVGPANWPVEFPRHAPPGDHSLNPSEPGMTFNPWPSSDWIAFLSERGPAAAVLIALAILGLAATAFRHIAASADSEHALVATVLLATLIGAVVSGLFDAVLLLPLPTLLVWTTLGALFVPSAAATVAAPRRVPVLIALAVIAITAVGVVRSASQLFAMDVYATTGDRAALERASQVDPGNFRLHLRLARSGRRAQRCMHASAAHDLFPTSAAASALARTCR